MKSRIFSGLVLLLWAAANLEAATFQPKEQQLAALALPTGPQADWRQWDSFLTAVVKKLGQEMRPALRDQLAETFLDARYHLTTTLRAGATDPVPELFQETWARLAPIVKQAIPASGSQAAQYRSFIAAMDAASSLRNSLQRFGLFRISPDALRRAAGLINAGDGDPLAYTAEVDSVLRTLLGFDSELPAIRSSAQPLEKSRWRGLQEKASAAARSVLVRPAHAAEPDYDRLNQWVPETLEVPDYLLEVRELLTETANKVLTKSSLAAQHQSLYRQLVYATGWQESCWRQFIKKGEKLTPLASGTGDVGLMQVNRVTWRSLYDEKGLTGDINYNGHAGAEILHHYLTRYAIPKREDKQPRGHLARATYSAYNAGPGGLARYRGVRQSAVWKKVDEAFWAKFQAVSAEPELAVKSCYGQ